MARLSGVGLVCLCSLDLASPVVSAMKQDEDRSTLTTHIPNGNNYREKNTGFRFTLVGLGAGSKSTAGAAGVGSKGGFHGSTRKQKGGHTDLC